MIKAVIFDMDGVLVDSEPETLKQRLGYFEQLGIEVTPELGAKMIGLNLSSLWPQVLPGKTEATYQQLQDEYVTYKHAHPFNYAAVMQPTVREFFDWLKKHGYRIAIASASDHEFIAMMGRQTGLADDIDVITSGTDFERSKPDPAVYLATLQKLGLDADEAVAVEDSAVGIQAAKAAGLVTFAVPIRDPRFAQDQGAADYRVPNLMAIHTYLQAEGGPR
ncbi:HAD family hydrolase [Lacticaseibacillus saniviri]|uniref:Uncharacterized protein n=1 Tax=Lacticaseibacillus saniviri JCM 17471 = DSM 24301 TaxID=1293598 RepID=A0A0R2MY20_9LACO|nr:HAD family phosphatase [Lacticaseibacillus saniviri]KRO18453.1 hypothetical protein IV56_GL001587 [Lacticaseibacillus saniviri JCM 17471 = DSM 24301]